MASVVEDQAPIVIDDDEETVDCAEIFSPPRVCAQACILGFKPGFSHDMLTGVDMMSFEGRARVWADIEKAQPRLLVSSPPCTWFSKLQNMNMRHYSARERAARDHDAKLLLAFGIACCRKQHMSGRFFVHEHPWTATSWQYEPVQALAAETGVSTVDFDQCAVGLRSPDGNPIKKRTRLLTNSPNILTTFATYQCQCGPEVKHTVVMGANLGVPLSRFAQVYTRALCLGLLTALD